MLRLLRAVDALLAQDLEHVLHAVEANRHALARATRGGWVGATQAHELHIYPKSRASPTLQATFATQNNAGTTGFAV